jgi:uncharacterized DUF497 family protein
VLGVAKRIYKLLRWAQLVISGFDWDDANILRIGKHQFTPEEVEEVFAGEHKVRRARQKLYIALGETLDGRLSLVVFRRLAKGVVRVITIATWMALKGG